MLKVKFDQAAYAQEKNDFDLALRLYGEIQHGADENGSFDTFPSSCIMNNMAVAFFKKQADKKFRASTLLIQALSNQPLPQHETDIIQQNLEALDSYVNQ